MQEENKKVKNQQLQKLYSTLKQNLIINSNEDENKIFSEKSQIFSITILVQILFIFTIIKAILSFIYFIQREKVFFNLNIMLIIIQITISLFLVLNQTKRNLFNNLLESICTDKILRCFYIFLFCLEENMTIYYFNHFTYNFNPGFIFFVLLFLVFYNLKTTLKFHTFMFYLYILNLVFLLYFPSIKNLMNFFIPFNLVLCMFIILNVISHKFYKKIIIIKNFQHFYENLVEVIFGLKKKEFYIVYNKKIIYGDNFNDDTISDFSNDKKYFESNLENNFNNYLENDDNLNQRRSTEFSEIYFDTIVNLDRDKFNYEPIKDFKGFEIVYRKDD